jgi:hypothetical protein
MRIKTGSVNFRNTFLSKTNNVNLWNITIGNKKEVYNILFFKLFFFSKNAEFSGVSGSVKLGSGPF